MVALPDAAGAGGAARLSTADHVGRMATTTAAATAAGMRIIVTVKKDGGRRLDTGRELRTVH
jgi:hypothetical protein